MPGNNTNTIDPELLKKQQQEQQVGNTASEGAVATQPITVTPAETVEPTAPVEEQQPSESQRYLDQIFKQYEERKKQNERADKRDRVREAIGGIGDVASALAKLHYTTQYAPYVGGENLSEKARQRYEKAKANRDANLDQWMHYMLNVAGKKQAAEQAEKTRQDTKAYRDATLKQREQEQEQRAQAAARMDAEQKEDKAIKQYADTYSPLWRSWARDGKVDLLDNELAELERKRDAGKISAREYEGMKDAITKAVNTVADKNSQTEYNTQHKTSGRGGSGGSKVDTFYTPFGDVSWPKDKTGKTYGKNLGDVFEVLPKDYLERYSGSATVRQMEWAIDNFFASPEYTLAQKRAVYDKLVEVGKKNPPQQPTKPKGGGSLLPNQKGKTTGSLLPKK